MNEDLSAIDLKILEQIQENSSLSTSELAEKVGLSQSPCWRRLQRLREDGYIRREVALLDRSKIGTSVIIFSTMKVAALTSDQREEFFRKIESTPEIVECHSIFGERDVFIKVIVPSLDYYQRFVFRNLRKLPGVTDVQSIVTLAEYKYVTALPVRKIFEGE